MRVDANIHFFLFAGTPTILYPCLLLLLSLHLLHLLIGSALRPPSSSTSASSSSSWWLPFGRDVLLLLSEGSEAVVSQEGPAVTPDEALDALTPPAGVSVAAALEHQRPAGKRERECRRGNVGVRSKLRPVKSAFGSNTARTFTGDT